MPVQPVGALGVSGSLVIQKNHLEDTGANSIGHVLMAKDPTDALGGYDALNDVLENVETAFNNADASITTRLSTEESNRAVGDASLAVIDGSLETRISSEESLAVAQFTSVDARVSADESNLTAAAASLAVIDGSLETRISSEESLAVAQFTSVDNRVSADESTLVAEVASLETVDSGLDSRLSAMESDFVWDGVDTVTIGNHAKIIFIEDSTDMYLMVKQA